MNRFGDALRRAADRLLGAGDGPDATTWRGHDPAARARRPSPPDLADRPALPPAGPGGRGPDGAGPGGPGWGETDRHLLDGDLPGLAPLTGVTSAPGPAMDRDSSGGGPPETGLPPLDDGTAIVTHGESTSVRVLMRGMPEPWRFGPQVYLLASGRSDRGRRHQHEEAFRITDGMLVVADGVGGAPGGAQAAAVAVDSSALAAEGGAGGLAELEGAAHRAHADVVRAARRDPRFAGMATTLDLACLGEDPEHGPTLFGLHAGDAVVWYLPAGGAPRALTTRHVDESGRLLHMIGRVPRVRYDTWSQSVRPGDRIVMATDGLWADLGEPAVLSLLHATASLTADDTADVLVDVALKAGGSDNVTVIVAQVGQDAFDRLPDPIEDEATDVPVPRPGG